MVPFLVLSQQEAAMQRSLSLLGTLVVVDFDQTLYVNGCIPQANKDALSRIVCQGGRWTIATGRHYEWLAHELEGLTPNTNFVIVECGATTTSIDGTPLKHWGLPDEAIVRLQAINLTNLECAIFRGIRDGERYILYSENVPHNVTLEPGVNEVRDIASFTRLIGEQGCGKLTLKGVIPSNHQLRRFPRTRLYSSGDWHDLLPRNVSKGSALTWAIRSKAVHGITKIVVIGDSGNDIPLFKRARESQIPSERIAVGNHPELLRYSTRRVDYLAEAF